MDAKTEALAHQALTALLDRMTAPARRFTGTVTDKIYDPAHTNPEDWVALSVTEYEGGREVDRYITMRADGTHTATGSLTLSDMD
jgi:hypothetical protein